MRSFRPPLMHDAPATGGQLALKRKRTLGPIRRLLTTNVRIAVSNPITVDALHEFFMSKYSMSIVQSRPRMSLFRLRVGFEEMLTKHWLTEARIVTNDDLPTTEARLTLCFAGSIKQFLFTVALLGVFGVFGWLASQERVVLVFASLAMGVAGLSALLIPLYARVLGLVVRNQLKEFVETGG
jgi:hypothetical protein